MRAGEAPRQQIRPPDCIAFYNGRRMGRVTISIALCTYNGDRYVEEQLDSFLAQSRMPDELVVCDDGSQDNTIEIVSRFAERATFPVRLFVNDSNLGSTKNFERAIGQCNGDLIALADQDDVWFPDKLELSGQLLEQCPEVMGVFSDAVLTGGELESLGDNLWDAAGFDRERRRRFRAGDAFSVLLQRQIVTGATFVFRSAYRDLVLPIPEYVVHDAWIAFLLAGVGTLDFIEEPLMYYRQHGKNQIGATKLTTLDRVANPAAPEVKRNNLQFLLQFSVEARQRLTSTDYPLQDRQVLQKLDERIRHLWARISLPGPRWRRTIPILNEVVSGRYASYSYGMYSAARDFMGSSSGRLI